MHIAHLVSMPHIRQRLLRRSIAAAAVAITGAILLSGCTPAQDESSPPPAPQGGQTTPASGTIATAPTAQALPMLATQSSTSAPETKIMPTDVLPAKLESAIFGMGCFWSPEELYRQIPGVVKTAVGYTGGATPDPTYEEVCTDTTGHAEVIQVEYDPNKVSYAALLDTFWKHHNPTQLNRQGPDVGRQYRSAIFYTSPEQEKIARESKERIVASKLWSRPIVTEIVPAGTFHRAEEYHQRYYQKRGGGSCPTVQPH